jgi:hypothetical protein
LHLTPPNPFGDGDGDGVASSTLPHFFGDGRGMVEREKVSCFTFLLTIEKFREKNSILNEVFIDKKFFLLPTLRQTL